MYSNTSTNTISEEFNVKHVSYFKNDKNIEFNEKTKVMKGHEGLLELASLNCDVLITTGGVSVGDADYVKEVLEKLGKVWLTFPFRKRLHWTLIDAFLSHYCFPNPFAVININWPMIFFHRKIV